MPGERVSMRQIREVLRLRFASALPQRGIAKSLGLSQGAVSGYLSRARAAGVSWPLPADLDDVQLEALLFPPPPAIAGDQRPMPDWAWVHRELRRPNVTLALLWEEYGAGAPDGFGYSWFCDLYRGWAGRLKPTMRQAHLAGEKLFVDFAGRTVEVTFGDFQLIEFAAQFFPFGIKPRQPLGNPLLLLFHQRSHLSRLSLVRRPSTIRGASIFSDECK